MKRAWLWAVLLVLAACAFTAARFFSQAMDLRNHFFNSDGLFFAALYDGVVVKGQAFTDWALTPAPYYFPDMLGWFTVRWLSGSVFWPVPILALAQIAALFALARRLLARVLSAEQAWLGAGLGVATLVVAAGLDVNPYFLLLITGFHVGAYLSGLWALDLVLGGLAAGEVTVERGIGLAVLSLAITASDVIYVTQLVIPLGLLLLLHWRQARAKVLRLGTALAAGTLVGWLSWRLLTPNLDVPWSLMHAFGIEPGAPGIPHLERLIVTLRDLERGAPVILYLWPVGVALLGLAAWRGWRVQGDPLRRTALMFPLCSALASVLVFFLVRNSHLECRYLLPLFYGPFVFAAAALPARLGSRGRLALGGALAVVLLVMMVRAWPLGQPWQTRYALPEQACVDAFVEESGERHAIGGYWMTKPYVLLGDSGLEVEHVDRTLHRWQLASGPVSERLRHDLILCVDGVCPDYSSLGGPRRSVACGRTLIMDYGPEGITLPEALHDPARPD